MHCQLPWCYVGAMTGLFFLHKNHPNKHAFFQTPPGWGKSSEDWKRQMELSAPFFILNFFIVLPQTKHVYIPVSSIWMHSWKSLIRKETHTHVSSNYGHPIWYFNYVRSHQVKLKYITQLYYHMNSKINTINWFRSDHYYSKLLALNILKMFWRVVFCWKKRELIC